MGRSVKKRTPDEVAQGVDELWRIGLSMYQEYGNDLEAVNDAIRGLKGTLIADNEEALRVGLIYDEIRYKMNKHS